MKQIKYILIFFFWGIHKESCLQSSIANNFAGNCWDDASFCGFRDIGLAYKCVDWTLVRVWQVPSPSLSPHWIFVNG
jgi:hypothetical protein